MERLTENVGNGVQIKGCGNSICMAICNSKRDCSVCPIDEAFRKLAKYETLEEQGLLVRLPCKEVYSMSGDTVYFIFEDEIIECIHCGLDICGSDGEGYIILGAYEDIFPYRDPDPEHDLDPTDWCRNTNHVSLSEIGKTLFFTREKAKKKLEEMKKND